jgi:hypothetical protein
MAIFAPAARALPHHFTGRDSHASIRGMSQQTPRLCLE